MVACFGFLSTLVQKPLQMIPFCTQSSKLCFFNLSNVAFLLLLLWSRFLHVPSQRHCICTCFPLIGEWNRAQRCLKSKGYMRRLLLLLLVSSPGQKRNLCYAPLAAVATGGPGPASIHKITLPDVCWQIENTTWQIISVGKPIILKSQGQHFFGPPAVGFGVGLVSVYRLEALEAHSHNLIWFSIWGLFESPLIILINWRHQQFETIYLFAWLALSRILTSSSIYRSWNPL